MSEAFKESSLALTCIDIVLAQENITLCDKKFSSFCNVIEFIDNSRSTLPQDEYVKIREAACHSMAALKGLSVEGFAVFCDLFHEDADWNQFKKRMECQILSVKTLAATPVTTTNGSNGPGSSPVTSPGTTNPSTTTTTTTRIAEARAATNTLRRNDKFFMNARARVASLWGKIGADLVANGAQTFVCSMQTIATEHPRWSDAVHHFNQAIFWRITNPSRISAVEIRTCDVLYVTKNWVGKTPVPLTEEQLQRVGCRLDEKGLITRGQ
ncbi:hypothetical protein AJ79_00555 [Helicocarpus griseus UAMH5409]|uniref:Uncharacterized protein n=1 Tax=Helicocarpus griseus UAMH5409 TaxID=1447875 RepID=A0A2B7YC97_9EURO|nr:hypothetical protein AJ79_00555 [Helicocarpus griseus UAMH5409]